MKLSLLVSRLVLLVMTVSTLGQAAWQDVVEKYRIHQQWLETTAAALEKEGKPNSAKFYRDAAAVYESMFQQVAKRAGDIEKWGKGTLKDRDVERAFDNLRFAI